MQIHHQQATSRYVLEDEAGVFAGEVEYLIDNGVKLLVRAEIPPDRRGGGVGVHLVRQTLDLIKKEGSGPIRPICPFIAKFIAKNPEYQSMVG